MKNNIIKILKDDKISNEERYTQLLQAMTSHLNIGQIRNFQSGFSTHKLEVLTYESRKKMEISDLDLHNYKADEKNDQNEEPVGSSAPEGGQSETEVSEQDSAFIKDLKANADAQEGLKIRDEYPFLKDPNCPVEILGLVGAKITAWEQLAQNREILDFMTVLPNQSEEITAEQQKIMDTYNAYSDVEKEDFIYMIAKNAVAEFQLNADIKDELDFYKEQGKVLGKHPALNDLKIAQEIAELDEAGLVKMKTAASKNASKAKLEIESKGTNEAREKRVNDWSLRLKLAEQRLAAEFPKK